MVTFLPLFVIEGADGVGHGTMMEIVMGKWVKRGLVPLPSSEPDRQRPTGQLIRTFLSGSGDVSNATLMLLYVADRIEHFRRMVYITANSPTDIKTLIKLNDEGTKLNYEKSTQVKPPIPKQEFASLFVASVGNSLRVAFGNEENPTVVENDVILPVLQPPVSQSADTDVLLPAFISDRGWVSTYVFQGLLGKIPERFIMDVHDGIQLPRALGFVLLDAPASVSVERIAKRSKYEFLDDSFFVEKSSSYYPDAIPAILSRGASVVLVNATHDKSVIYKNWDNALLELMSFLYWGSLGDATLLNVLPERNIKSHVSANTTNGSIKYSMAAAIALRHVTSLLLNRCYITTSAHGVEDCSRGVSYESLDRVLNLLTRLSTLFFDGDAALFYHEPKTTAAHEPDTIRFLRFKKQAQHMISNGWLAVFVHPKLGVIAGLPLQDGQVEQADINQLLPGHDNYLTIGRWIMFG